MRFGLMGLVCLALTACTTPATAQQRDFTVAAAPVLADNYPQQVQTWPGGVTSLSDVTYSSVTGYRPMVIDIYLPPREMGARPMVMYIHGGGWVGGHTRHSGALADFPGTLARLAAEGFVVVSLEYRLAAEARFPAQLQDVRAALRYMRANAGRYSLDPARVGVWGGSAGGHLAALATLSCGIGSLDVPGTTAPEGSECAQAAVTWYGVFDFTTQTATRSNGDPGIASLLGCEGACTADDYGPASPVTYIDPSDPPMLLIHGETDAVVSIEQSRQAERLLTAAGVPVRSIYIPGVDHSFIGHTPESTRAATVMATNATFDFFHEVLDAPAQ